MEKNNGGNNNPKHYKPSIKWQTHWNFKTWFQNFKWPAIWYWIDWLPDLLIHLSVCGEIRALMLFFTFNLNRDRSVEIEGSNLSRYSSFIDI